MLDHGPHELKDFRHFFRTALGTLPCYDLSAAQTLFDWPDGKPGLSLFRIKFTTREAGKNWV